MISLCENWEFTDTWSQGFCTGEGQFDTVRLPHTPREMPLHYGSSKRYQMVCGYRRKLNLSGDMGEKRLFLQFEGAGHIATVYVNGQEAFCHRCGYTGFRVEITELVHPGENLLAVKLDTTENPEVPPFGFVIDYLTYGGLYREVWLDVRGREIIEDVFVSVRDPETAHVQIRAQGGSNFRVSVLEEDGICLAAQECGAEADIRIPNARLWTLEDPHRYILRCDLLDERGNTLDTQQVKFGLRTLEYTAEGFYLNGKKTFLRGLNRHQCWPYIGYAAPEQLQREDARILKEELGCVIVRTSHYPQSHYFVDECDRLGLLVFMEIPGWQHIGDEVWQDQAVENTREMVLQYRNHPSIILWGVRINESQDNDNFYRRTNAAARELDPTRPTTGVRFMEKSSLLEDVYSYNDFSHTGNNPGVKPKGLVTPDLKKGLLITEHNGHMFPTKSFDTWQKRQEHALRHARVQSDAASDGGHIGCIGWCMFDYATHKDFGSGDRICYHGVMDAFRNPKLAASVYAAQQEKNPVLTVGSAMDIGDYPGGNLGRIHVFTNAEEVRLYKNGAFVSTLTPGDYPGLSHGPLLLEDTIGDLMQEQEGFGKKKADQLKRALLSAGKYGLAAMPLADKLRMAWCMLRYKMTLDEGVKLYGKYVGNWGGESTIWRFDALRNGKVTATATCCPSSKLHLDVRPSHLALWETATYDMAAVRVRILDEFENPAPYAQLPVRFSVTGTAELVGPDVVTAEGGMCGTYIRTTGQTGTAVLTVHAEGLTPITLKFTSGR